MADSLPYIGFGYDDNGALCAVVGPDEYTSLAQLLAAAPYIAEDGNALHLARALNHFAQGMSYGVIDDIEPYKKDFLERYAAEEELEWDQFIPRVGDFDLPDLGQLALPSVSGGQITFFANLRAMDAPYKVTGPADGSGTLDYEPL